MKNRAFITISTLLAGASAYAGFQHPVEDTGAEAQQIQNTPHPREVAVKSATRVMPDRAAAKAPSAAPLKLPSEVKKHEKITSSKGPVPKAPALPSPSHFGVPAMNLPHASDGLISPSAPEKLSLKGLNRPQIHAFLKHARELPVPTREFTKIVGAREVANRYQSALHPEPGKSFRTAYSLTLGKIGKIQQPPSVTQYENMVKRIDSLFDALDLRYALSVKNLWELSENTSNARELQARDALFAGLLSSRAGWETTSALMYESAASKRVDREERYLKILWAQLEKLHNPVHLDKVVAAVSPRHVLDTSPSGDRANYAIAKRLLTGRFHAPLLVPPGHEIFQQRIASQDLRDKLSVLEYVGQLRSKNEGKRAAAVAGLRAIESNGSEENRQQARLALARTLLQHGEATEALAFYRGVTKDRKNRLAVLGEQTYAEFSNGEYQEALGKTLALETPSFTYGFAPDVHLVEIMSRKAMCDFGGAEEGVQRFHERYTRELQALEATLARTGAPEAYYEELMSFADLEKPFRFQRYLLQLTNVMENQKTMNAALTEIKKLDELGLHQKTLERPENWEGFTAALRARWGERAQELRRGSARAALTEVSYLAQRLHHTFDQVELLDLDISTAAAKNYNLQSALNFPAQKQAQRELDKDHEMRWPFDSELWEDEIDFLKAKNPSKCAVAKTAAL